VHWNIHFLHINDNAGSFLKNIFSYRFMYLHYIFNFFNRKCFIVDR